MECRLVLDDRCAEKTLCSFASWAIRATMVKYRHGFRGVSLAIYLLLLPGLATGLYDGLALRPHIYGYRSMFAVSTSILSFLLFLLGIVVTGPVFSQAFSCTSSGYYYVDHTLHELLGIIIGNASQYNFRRRLYYGLLSAAWFLIALWIALKPEYIRGYGELIAKAVHGDMVISMWLALDNLSTLCYTAFWLLVSPALLYNSLISLCSLFLREPRLGAFTRRRP